MGRKIVFGFLVGALLVNMVFCRDALAGGRIYDSGQKSATRYGDPVWMRKIQLIAENITYGLWYCVLQEPSPHGYLVPCKGFRRNFPLGLEKPSSANWSRLGFGFIMVNGRTIPAFSKAEFKVVKDTPDIGEMEIIWKADICDVKMRFVVISGSDSLFVEFKIIPTAESLKSARVVLKNFPSSYKKPRKRIIVTSEHAFKPNATNGGGGELDLTKEKWIFYGDEIHDPAIDESRDTEGPSGLLYLPFEVEKVKVVTTGPKGDKDYCVDTHFFLNPENPVIHLALWDFHKWENDKALKYIKERVEKDYQNLLEIFSLKEASIGKTVPESSEKLSEKTIPGNPEIILEKGSKTQDFYKVTEKEGPSLRVKGPGVIEVKTYTVGSKNYGNIINKECAASLLITEDNTSINRALVEITGEDKRTIDDKLILTGWGSFNIEVPDGEHRYELRKEKINGGRSYLAVKFRYRDFISPAWLNDRDVKTIKKKGVTYKIKVEGGQRLPIDKISKVYVCAMKDNKVEKFSNIQFFLEGDKLMAERREGTWMTIIYGTIPGKKSLSIRHRLKGIYEEVANLKFYFFTRPRKAADIAKNFFPFGMNWIAGWQLPYKNDEETLRFIDNDFKNISQELGMNFIYVNDLFPGHLDFVLNIANKYGLKVSPLMDNWRFFQNAIQKWGLMPKLGKAEPNFPRVKIWKVKGINIDGRLDDSGWMKAGIVNGFLDAKEGVLVNQQTIGYLGYDDKYLYIALKGLEDSPQKIRANIRERDGYVWEEDSFEIFLDTNRDKASYFHLVTNSIGTMFDQRVIPVGIMDRSWNASWKVATSVKDDYWIAEIAIPFSGLKVTTPNKGDVWGLNLCRNQYRGCSAWAYTKGAFHRPALFGTLEFGGERLLRKINVSGQANDENGFSVPNCKIILNSFVVESNQDGRFSAHINGSIGGKLSILGLAEGYFPYKSIVTIDRDTIEINLNMKSRGAESVPIVKVYEYIKRKVDELKGNESLFGYWWDDEPHSDRAEFLGFMQALVRDVDKEHLGMVIFLGGSPSHTIPCFYAMRPDQLLIDYYPVGREGINIEAYIKALDDAYTLATNNNVPLWLMAQIHGVKERVNKDGPYSVHLRTPTPAEVRFQTYTAIAHGAKGLCYHIYRGHNWSGLRDYTGIVEGPNQNWKTEKSDSYWELKKLGEEMKVLGPILLKLKKSENIIIEKSDKSDVQTFEDSKGNKYLVIVNQDVKADNDIKVSIDRKKAGRIRKIIEQVSKKDVPFELKKSHYEFSYHLEPGGGRILKLE